MKIREYIQHKKLARYNPSPSLIDIVNLPPYIEDNTDPKNPIFASSTKSEWVALTDDKFIIIKDGMMPCALELDHDVPSEYF